MKTKIKFSLLTVLSACLITLTSFVASNPHGYPSVYVPCEALVDERPFNSRLVEFEEIECPTCELERIEQLWNSDGLLEGTLYEYGEGSEPTIFTKIDCDYSPNFQHQCVQITVTILNSGCGSFFEPCTKEEDIECVHD